MSIKNKFHFLIFLFNLYNVFSQNEPPVLITNSRQFFCPQTQIKIAPNFTISDKYDTSIAILFVQISTGLKYVISEVEDYTYPTITSVSLTWKYIYYELLK